MTMAPPEAKLLVARIPYLNCAPFFHGLAPDGPWNWVDVSPRQLGLQAERGQLVAGPMALADYLRLQDTFERLGTLGIAVRGRCASIALFSRKPIRQLDGSTIAVTDHTSTTALLLRLILEQRYAVVPQAYPAFAASDNQSRDAEGLLLIGDEALTFRVTNRSYPYETDLAFEWWLWQHLPCVFAVWVVRKDCAAAEKQRLSRLLQRQLAVNLSQLEVLAQERAQSLGLPASNLKQYLEGFVYRFSAPEEDAIRRFAQLVHEHHVL